MSWWKRCNGCGEQLGVVRRMVAGQEEEPVVEVVLVTNDGRWIPPDAVPSDTRSGWVRRSGNRCPGCGEIVE